MLKLDRAKQFATNMHDGQARKYTREPYITHPASVVEITKTFCFEVGVKAPVWIDMLCAAWLHDVVEDCGVKFSEIRVLFGARVEDFVFDLTDVSKPEDGNRAVRKTLDLEHLRSATFEAQLIKCADLIDNTRSIALYDAAFAKIYLPEKISLLSAMKDETKNSMIGCVALATVKWGLDHVNKN